MSFLFFLIYLTLTYLRPFELYRPLGPFRLMLVVGALGLMVTLASIPFSRFSFRAKQVPLLVGFTFWISLSLVFALHWLGGGLQALSAFSITLITFVLAVFSVDTEKRLRITLMVIVALSIFLVFQSVLAVHFGVLHNLLVLDERQVSGATLSRVRGTGFMQDPNDLAQSLVTAIPFLLLVWRRGAAIQNLVLVVIPTAFLLYGVYLTHSRGAIVSLLVILFVAMRPKFGSALSGVTVVIGVLGALVMAVGGRGLGMDQSATNRVEAWSKGLQLLKAHPLSGVGFGMFTDFHDITAHNSFVLCFSELGVPGYFLWLTLLVVTSMELNAIQKLPATTEADLLLRRLARSVQIGFYGFLVSAWFLSRTYTVTLYLLIALAVSVAEIARRQGKTLGPFSYPAIASRTGAIMVASVVFIYLQIKLQVR